MTLAQAALPTRSILTNLLLILAGSLFVAIAAQVSVPMIPVPMTLQTLAISIVGLTYGSRLAGLTLVAYLIEGALGLPVFAEGKATAALVGPTAGFLFGFPVMAYLTGLMVERGLDKGLVKLFVAAFIPSLLLFIPGVIVLKLVLDLSWSGAVTGGMTPFLIGDVVKTLIAAMAVVGGWKLLKRG